LFSLNIITSASVKAYKPFEFPKYLFKENGILTPYSL